MNPTSATPSSLRDPKRTERVGAALAERLRPHEPAFVVCWDTSEDVVLAHVVARELGADLLLANEIEGIVALEYALPDGATVVLVAESLDSPTAVAGLAGVVDHAKARVAAVATAHGRVEVAGTRAEGAAVVTAEAA
ncbi:hypothetical protein OG417_35205 [Actinoallomurus sp. NBC_01490]|jgi:hypothetical protein|uniref:hypothetical protein n=1 Tax=Actinoallomurus sp. NBC_01490 TaxID=2903557 RepID=UPI002E305079|nr:hypothetical protein [Actinoallomurus sp. NBC_01490]